MIDLFNIEAEQSVIGGILLDDKALDLISFLEPAHFYQQRHRDIFAAMRSMASQNKQIDLVTLTDEMNGAKEVGGIMYLAELSQNTPGSANVKRYAEVVVEKSTMRALVEAGANIQNIANEPGSDVSDKVNRSQAEVMRLTESSIKRDPKSVREILSVSMDAIERRGAQEIDGQLTGLRDLDEKLNGLKAGELIIIGARPAMGKSVLAVQIALNIAQTGKSALVLSQEMPYQQLADRLIASTGRVDMSNITTGKLCQDGWNRVAAAVGKLHDLKLYLDDQPALTIADVCSKARMTKRKHGLDVLVIDYLQLMSGTGTNRNAEIEEVSRGLKSLAKELHIPVVALSQLGRDVERRTNRRPIMSDLRDSGAIEQDADVILFIYRDEEYNPDTMEKGIAEILIRKNRQGKTGDIRMAFNGEFARFDDLAFWYEPPVYQEPKRLRSVDL